MLNPGVNLPARAIKPVHRKDGGGTTFLWTEYLSLVSPEWKARVGVGNQVAWPTGIESKGSEGMTGVVSRTPGSLGYTERTYALANKLPFGAVRNKSGDFITPTLESATAAAAGLATIPDDLRFSLIDAPGPALTQSAEPAGQSCTPSNPGTRDRSWSNSCAGRHMKARNIPANAATLHCPRCWSSTSSAN